MNRVDNVIERMDNAPLNALRHHVTGAIERGEKEAITEMKGTTLYVTKRMNDTILGGELIHETIRFVSADRALVWVHTMIQKWMDGTHTDYELVDYTFQKRRCDS